MMMVTILAAEGIAMVVITWRVIGGPLDNLEQSVDRLDFPREWRSTPRHSGAESPLDVEVGRSIGVPVDGWSWL
jgi:hypothetical protein